MYVTVEQITTLDTLNGWNLPLLIPLRKAELGYQEGQDTVLGKKRVNGIFKGTLHQPWAWNASTVPNQLTLNYICMCSPGESSRPAKMLMQTVKKAHGSFHTHPIVLGRKRQILQCKFQRVSHVSLQLQNNIDVQRPLKRLKKVADCQMLRLKQRWIVLKVLLDFFHSPGQAKLNKRA